MKKNVILLMAMCLILINFTIGYTQEINLDQLQASDVNVDGAVNILDLTLVAAHFGTTPAADQILNPDANGDGVVNILDLTLVASHLGSRIGYPV